ncbi:MAG: orotidine-5'-phosphate decarboxylase [Alphaproteobacteria bacterium]|nr:orotidine-5'-phosphate decarboxylase [Alphaproteobacteria bacterium]
MSGPVYVALDMTDAAEAASLAKRLRGHVGGVKLGLEFFVANGPGGIRAVSDAGLPVFLDLKLHDIPNTVAGAMASAAALNPAIVTTHAGGGAAMMRAASEAAAAAKHPPLVIAVTVLTSLDDQDLEAVGQRSPALEQAVRLALLAKESGLGGVVCSPHEVAAIRARCGTDFKLVVPGIRPASAALGDQKRVMTPAQAIAAGADHLVIGRPITQAPDPVAAAQAIAAELRAG